MAEPALRADVSVLFCDLRGPYPGLVADCWGEERDARLYAGPNPVICHPPCQLWTNFAGLNYKRYGGAHNRPGNDGGCFASALDAVRRWGGVLEHPAGSYAWETFYLPPPAASGWVACSDGWTAEVWQSAYGHKARKRTWLFYSGEALPLELNWSRSPGSHQCGWFDRKRPTLSKREASATPLAFAELLVSIAAQAKPALRVA